MRKGVVVALIILTFSGCSRKVDTNQRVVVEENTINYKMSGEQITLSYEINNIEKQKKNDGTYIITANGMNNTYDDIPLPYVSYVLALPIDTDIDTVSIGNAGKTKSMEDVEISSCGLDTIGLSSTTRDITKEPCKTVIHVQSLQGVKIAYITLYPFMYDESQSILTWLEEGEINISLQYEKWDLSHFDTLDRVRNCVDNLEMLDEYSLYIDNE